MKHKNKMNKWTWKDLLDFILVMVFWGIVVLMIHLIAPFILKGGK